METSSLEVPSRRTRNMSAKLFSVVSFFVVVLVLIIILYFVSSPSKGPRGPLLQTKLGVIRGHYLTSYGGNKYEAYEGIPYAQPPIGQRRFQSPMAIEPWSIELQATKVKPKCLQDVLGEPDAAPIGSEDCLYLNIYVPTKVNTNGSFIVIFYIHGGYFQFGGPRNLEEQYIIDYDVIFVSAQYRIGILGFLSTEDDVVPGNMGLKDQSMALRWTYDNIETFGGDPKTITLVGGSSGGSSVHLHYLSPWSRGLFHAGMSLSGSAFACHSIVENHRENAFKIARAINCTEKDIGHMIQCLKDVPAEVLVGKQHILQLWWNVNYGIFGPVVENVSWSVDPFIDDYPSRIFEEGKAYDVPWIAGFVPEEGLVLTAGYTNNSLKYVDENWDTLAPIILDYTYTIPKEEHVNVARKIRKHYLGDKPIDRENFRAFVHLVGDRVFAVGMVKAAKFQATVNKSPVFLYYYTYRATDSISNKYSNSTEDLGVCHGDDIHLVTKDATLNPSKSDKDIAMQRIVIKMWTSMAHNRVPDIGIKWPNVLSKNKTCLEYVHLSGPEDYKLECSDMLAEYTFWKSVGFDEK